MHITLIISSLNPGGAERVLSDLANYLVTKQYQITIVTFAAPQTLAFYKLSPKINIIQINQPQQLDNKFNLLGYLMRLKNIV